MSSSLPSATPADAYARAASTLLKSLSSWESSIVAEGQSGEPINYARHQAALSAALQQARQLEGAVPGQARHFLYKPTRAPEDLRDIPEFLKLHKEVQEPEMRRGEEGGEKGDAEEGDAEEGEGDAEGDAGKKGGGKRGRDEEVLEVLVEFNNELGKLVEDCKAKMVKF